MKVKEKTKLAQHQTMHQLLKQRQRAENETEVLKFHKEMTRQKVRLGTYKSYDKVIYEKDKRNTQESSRQVRENWKHKQRKSLGMQKTTVILLKMSFI